MEWYIYLSFLYNVGITLFIIIAAFYEPRYDEIIDEEMAKHAKLMDEIRTEYQKKSNTEANKHGDEIVALENKIKKLENEKKNIINKKDLEPCTRRYYYW